jgi:hypothetical protein
MTAKISCTVSEGLMPDERIAQIETADGGSEVVAVSSRNIQNNRLMASEVGRSDGKVLVELPRESDSGRWRIWVRESAIGD